MAGKSAVTATAAAAAAAANRSSTARASSRGGKVPAARNSSSNSPSRPVMRAAPAAAAGPTKRSPFQTRSPLPQLKSLLMHLASERGLSENTLHAYRRDLEDLDDYFRASGQSPLEGNAED